MISPNSVHRKNYAVVQCMLYLGADARCVQRLSQGYLVVLDGKSCTFEQKYELQMGQKMFFEEVMATLQGKVENLTLANEGFIIQNESLDRDFNDSDKLVVEVRLGTKQIGKDLNWLSTRVLLVSSTN